MGRLWLQMSKEETTSGALISPQMGGRPAGPHSGSRSVYKKNRKDRKTHLVQFHGNFLTQISLVRTIIFYLLLAPERCDFREICLLAVYSSVSRKLWGRMLKFSCRRFSQTLILNPKSLKSSFNKAPGLSLRHIVGPFYLPWPSHR